MKYIAHKREENEQEEIQTILEHLNNTAKRCSEFAKCIDLPEYGSFVGKLHDIGKYSNEFQKRINGATITVDHSTAGAQEAFKRKLLIAALCIAGHHGGLPDVGNPRTDSASDPTLIGRVKKNLNDYSAWKTEQSEYELQNTAEPLIKDRTEFFLKAHMMFSSLVDADFLDTEEFMSNGTVKRLEGDGLEVLLERLENHISKWDNPQSKLNKLRTQMLNECISSGQNDSDKLFTLTVPTGGGKTISSLAFALNYAVKHKKKRVIYVIPYTSIIEQNAEIFKNILGRENVIEHHSNNEFNKSNEETNIQEMLACENWDAPVVVTTAVQFFESIFSNRTSKNRKLHNIADSVVIFDEAQMLPVDYLYPCVTAMWQLVNSCKTTVVLCTATQPSLESFFKASSKSNMPFIIKEICPTATKVTDDFLRAKFLYDGKLEDDELALKINENEQVLCIVNKKSHAKNLYSLIGSSDDNFHLSTYMYPIHRKTVIAEIKRRLLNNENCRVISTSLIEAGVDIDFPTVYRAISGIDSILQAGGRCNRENKRSVDESIVHIFDTEHIGKYQQMNTSVARDVINKYQDKIYQPEAVKMYFDNLYYYRNASRDMSTFDIKGVVKSMEALEFKTVSEKFKIIENNTKTLYIPTLENKAEIEALRNGNYSRELFRSLQQYSLNLYDYDFKKLDYISAIEVVDGSFYILANLDYYDDKTGLIIPEQNSGVGIFL